MILKSYVVEQNVNILKNYQITLIYGQNNGIKDDIKQAIKEKNENSETIIFFEGEIIKNKNILYQNIVNESLFSEKKIIFIQEVSDKIYNEIIECLDKENKNVQIYLFSENLEKKSKLRNLFEKSTKLAIFPCYEDNDKTLITYVNKELKDFKGLTGEIVNLILSNSNMNRQIIKSELIKIKTFFLKKIINKDEIIQRLNIKSDTSFDKIRDSALNGEKIKINSLLSEIDFIADDIFFYLNNLNYRIVKLQEIIKMSGGDKKIYVESIDRLKPPIFWKDKPMIIRQLKNWTLNELNKVALKIGETEVLMKKNSHLRNDIVMKDLIIGLTSQASNTTSL